MTESPVMRHSGEHLSDVDIAKILALDKASILNDKSRPLSNVVELEFNTSSVPTNLKHSREGTRVGNTNAKQHNMKIAILNVL
jgi:hypothetical protein